MLLQSDVHITAITDLPFERPEQFSKHLLPLGPFEGLGLDQTKLPAKPHTQLEKSSN
jgi:hypothetical protein